MSDEDDATMMISAMDDAHPANKFKDVGGADDNDATMMWNPEAEAVDPQDAATVMMSPEMARAAVAAADAAHAPQAAPTASGGGGLLMVGAVGLFLAIIGLILTHVLSDVLVLFSVIKERPEQSIMIAAYMSSAVAWLMVGIGLFGAASRTGAFSIVAGVFVLLMAVGYLMGGIGVMAESRDLVKLFIQTLDPKAVALTPFFVLLGWIMLSVWGFVSSKITGGLGVTGGIFGILTGLLIVTAHILFWAKAMNRSSANVLGFLMIGAAVCGLVACILLGIGMLKARKA